MEISFDLAEKFVFFLIFLEKFLLSNSDDMEQLVYSEFINFF